MSTLILNTNIRWETKYYAELSLDELYAILKLRSQVFVVEQGFRFLEMDGLDKCAYHILGWKGEELVATSRLFAKDLSYPGYQAIGRVATSEACRGQGIGKELMFLSVQECQRLFGKNEDIKINAQHRLKSFYELFGFEQVGDIYLIDGVDHIAMIRYRSKHEETNETTTTATTAEESV
jgi:ElaA protein